MGKENKPEIEERQNIYGADAPSELHCRRCKTLLDKGVCPNCGYRVYIPMDEKKRNKIRLIATAVGVAVFAVLFVALKIIKG